MTAWNPARNRDASVLDNFQHLCGAPPAAAGIILYLYPAGAVANTKSDLRIRSGHAHTHTLSHATEKEEVRA